MSHRTSCIVALCATLAALGAGCPSNTVAGDAGGRDARVQADAGTAGDASTTVDSSTIGDAATGHDARPAGPNRLELTPAAGRVQGGGFKVDFQLGHSTGQNKLGGSHSIEGAAAVKP